jgi:hypothetical protein
LPQRREPGPDRGHVQACAEHLGHRKLLPRGQPMARRPVDIEFTTASRVSAYPSCPGVNGGGLISGTKSAHWGGRPEVAELSARHQPACCALNGGTTL